MTTTPNAILQFWFDEAGPARWWTRDAAFDDTVRTRLGAAYEAAASGDYDDWAGSSRGALALIILLDQVPRNIFRGSARSYATDAKALAIAKAALAAGLDRELSEQERHFLYMPLVHSEHLTDQDRAVGLGQTAFSDGDFLKHAQAHRDVIAQFGRFPHRNGLLGRDNTAEEQVYLDAGRGWG